MTYIYLSISLALQVTLDIENFMISICEEFLLDIKCIKGANFSAETAVDTGIVSINNYRIRTVQA